MATLPTPGGDNDTWGTELNTWLTVTHAADGTLRNNIYNVMDYGATGDGTTDDTTAIQAAITAASAPNRGTVFFPGDSTYLVSAPLTIYSDVDYVGAGVGASRIKLKAASNCDVFLTDSFATYTAGTSQNGPTRWSIRNLRIDGNGANQTGGTSWCMRSYGCSFIIENVDFINGKHGCVWSEWGTGGSDMESQWVNVKIRAGGATNSQGKGLDFQGPHDSTFTNLIINSADTFTGLHVRGNAGGEQFVNTHVWGKNDVNWKIEKPVRAYGAIAEGATVQNVLMLCGKNTWHGESFGTNGTNPTEIGFQLGDATHTGLSGNNIDINTWNWGSGSTPFVIGASGDGGSMIRVVGARGGATNLRSTTVNSKSIATFICTDDATQSTEFSASGVRSFNALVTAFAADGANGQLFRANTSSNPHAFQIGVGSRLQGYTDSFTTETFRLSANQGSIQPGTQSGLGGKIYSGSGAPGTITGSAAGDMYIRTDGGAGTWIYRATAANTWTAVI